jgi:mono/diheme cytochrome c family protein
VVKKRILLAAILCLSVWAITAGVAVGATVFSKPLNATVKVLPKGDFTYYSDAAATQPITTIALPDVNAGGTSTFTVYVKNTGKADVTIAAGVNNVPATTGTLALTFDGLPTKTLVVNAVSKLVGTLTAPATATSGTVNFAFNVDATPLATTTPPGGTTTTTTPPTASTVSYSSSIQSAFNQYCVSCHGNSGGVNLSSYSALMASQYNGTAVVTPGNSAGSILYQVVTSGNMSGYGMSSAQAQSLADWINQGAPNN